MSDDPYKSFDHHIKAQEAEITHLRARIAELEAALKEIRFLTTEADGAARAEALIDEVLAGGEDD